MWATAQDCCIIIIKTSPRRVSTLRLVYFLDFGLANFCYLACQIIRSKYVLSPVKLRAVFKVVLNSVLILSYAGKSREQKMNLAAVGNLRITTSLFLWQFQNNINDIWSISRLECIFVIWGMYLTAGNWSQFKDRHTVSSDHEICLLWSIPSCSYKRLDQPDWKVQVLIKLPFFRLFVW